MNKIKQKPETLIRALEAQRGNISAAARQLNINRMTLAKYIKSESSIGAAFSDINEGSIDSAENRLMDLVENPKHRDHFAAIRFYLKTKGKERGYIETHEVDYTQSIPETINLYTYVKGEKVSTNGLASNGAVPEDD